MLVTPEYKNFTERKKIDYVSFNKCLYETVFRWKLNKKRNGPDMIAAKTLISISIKAFLSMCPIQLTRETLKVLKILFIFCIYTR